MKRAIVGLLIAHAAFAIYATLSDSVLINALLIYIIQNAFIVMIVTAHSFMRSGIIMRAMLVPQFLGFAIGFFVISFFAVGMSDAVVNINGADKQVYLGDISVVAVVSGSILFLVHALMNREQYGVTNYVSDFLMTTKSFLIGFCSLASSLLVLYVVITLHEASFVFLIIGSIKLILDIGLLFINNQFDHIAQSHKFRFDILLK